MDSDCQINNTGDVWEKRLEIFNKCIRRVKDRIFSNNDRGKNINNCGININGMMVSPAVVSLREADQPALEEFLKIPIMLLGRRVLGRVSNDNAVEQSNEQSRVESENCKDDDTMILLLECLPHLARTRIAMTFLNTILSEEEKIVLGLHHVKKLFEILSPLIHGNPISIDNVDTTDLNDASDPRCIVAFNGSRMNLARLIHLLPSFTSNDNTDAIFVILSEVLQTIVVERQSAERKGCNEILDVVSKRFAATVIATLPPIVFSAMSLVVRVISIEFPSPSLDTLSSKCAVFSDDAIKIATKEITDEGSKKDDELKKEKYKREEEEREIKEKENKIEKGEKGLEIEEENQEALE